MELAKEWLGLAALIISVGGFIWNHLTAGGTKALKEVTVVKGDLKGMGEATVARFQLIEGRVQSIEGELKHMPDGQTAQRLELAVERLTGQLKVLEERMRPIAAINERLQEWALERGK